MTGPRNVVRTRLVPAVLTALGAALVTAGLVSWTDPSTAGPVGSASPIVSATPLPSPTPPSVTLPPIPSPSAASPAPTASVAADRVATRVAVPALRIDLPVILPEDPTGYPQCDVAMYIRELGQPGQGRAVYLYAHAREGMFLPLLEQSEIRDGEGMLGMLVQVWTSDEQLFIYEITEVRRHQTNLDDAVDADEEQLWLQTSEGPRGTVPKLQVVAEPVSSGPAPDPAAAHPTARPVDCA